MKYEDLCYQMEISERRPLQKNELIAKKAILEYLKQVNKDDMQLRTSNAMDNLLLEYFAKKETPDEKILLDILNEFNFNYSMSVHNAIYYLLSTENDDYMSVNPLSWPGVYSIQKNDSKYKLETILGSIEVYKANEILDSSVFDKQLMGQCYERTYDYIKENNQARAIISYMPNFFYGGHYHAYVKNEDSILDIAANALYYKKEYADKILCGDKLLELSYKQVKKKYQTIKHTTPQLSDKNKLLTLALYYNKNTKKMK